MDTGCANVVWRLLGVAAGRARKERDVRHLLEYEFDGERYVLELHASNQEEAMRRVRCLSANAVYLGEVVAVIPATLGWLARLSVWFANLIPRSPDR
jgi:hypothetical protein